MFKGKARGGHVVISDQRCLSSLGGGGGEGRGRGMGMRRGGRKKGNGGEEG